MSYALEILGSIEKAYQQKDFDSRDSILRLGKQGHYVFEWNSPDMRVKGELSELDSIGILLNSIEVSKNISQDEVMAEYLKETAEAIEKRINYLMEPLKIIELDRTTNAVQLRSEKPEINDGRLSYYELVLKAGKWFGYRNHVSIHRFSQHPEDEPNRNAVPFPVTKKQFQKLVDDLTEIL